MDDNLRQVFGLIGTLAPVIGAVAVAMQATGARAKKKAAQRAQADLSMARVNASVASAVSVSPIMPPVIAPARQMPTRPAAAAGLGAIPIAQPLPSAEGLLVSGLFTQPRSLVAAFVASEILGPPVAFRHH
jgi:hypothetical protein